MIWTPVGGEYKWTSPSRSSVSRSASSVPRLNWLFVQSNWRGEVRDEYYDCWCGSGKGHHHRVCGRCGGAGGGSTGSTQEGFRCVAHPVAQGLRGRDGSL